MAQKFPKYGDHTLDYFFTEEINENVASSRRFRVAVHRMGVRLQNLDKAPSTPDNLLETVIEFLINETRNQRTINGKRPDRFSVIFRSAVLQTPIQVSKSIFSLQTLNFQIGYGSFAQNTIDVCSFVIVICSKNF